MTDSAPYVTSCSIGLLGCKNVGKTSLIFKFLENSFTDSYSANTCVNSYVKYIQNAHQLIELTIVRLI